MPVEVAAGLLLHAGEILACRRRADQSHPGKWEFPGGKREAGESIAECLRRELEEELGIAAEIGDEVWRTEHRYGAGDTVSLVFFLVPAFAGTVENRVFAELRWVAVDALGQLDFLEADRRLIERLRTGTVRL